jgi:hypothetical protein
VGSRWGVVIVIGLVWLINACTPVAQSAPMRVVIPAPTEQPVTASYIYSTSTVTPSPTVPSISQITLPPTFTPTFTVTNTAIPMTDTPTSVPSPTATITPTVTASATITNTPPPYVTSTPFTWESGAQYANLTYEEALIALNATPTLFLPVDHTRRIYEHGQGRSLQSNFLLNVGDCNTENVNYLVPLTYLDVTSESTVIDALSLPMVEQYTAAFRFKGQSVNSGLNALSVMDSFWANAGTCFSGETPLACDVRVTQPFAALVMFGANDINVLTLEGYEIAMRDIIEYLLAENVIPILSTFSVREDVGDMRYATAIRFNGVLVRLAEEYQIPLVNFWRETLTLPDRGILSDNAHLKLTGFEIRNRLTIDMLEAIQANIIEPENAES